MAARPPTLRRQWLTEDVVRSGGPRLRVDREKGIIYGVKILGLESANGRRYLAKAVRKAIPLYEGRSVRINHPKRPDDQRDSEDVFGKLRNVEMGEDGSYGNLHFLKSHPMAERVCEAAERMPDVFGLSHNAQGEGETINGIFVVQEIVGVRSVDLVADPATTSGLFESRGHKVKTKLRAWMEGCSKRLDLAKRKAVKRLMEDGAMDPEMEMETSGDLPAPDAAPEDHMAALRTGFEGSCMAVITQALDGDLDPKEALKKLKELITTHGKLAGGATGGGGGEPVEEEEEDIEEECDPEEDKKMKESRTLKKRLRDMEAKDSARDLCEAAGVLPSKALLKALVSLPTEADRKELVEEHRGKPPAKPAPRSGGGGGKKTLVEAAAANGDEISDFMGALRR